MSNAALNAMTTVGHLQTLKEPQILRKKAARTLDSVTIRRILASVPRYA